MIERSAARSWLARAGIAGCVLLAAIIVTSAYLRLTTMGIGCSPWPECYGRMQMPTSPLQARAVDRSPTAVSVARLLHRAAAMLAAILAVLTLMLSLTRPVRRACNVALAASIVTLTILLAAVGRMSATLLVPAVGVVNLLGGFTLLACFWALRLNNDARARDAADNPCTRAAGFLLLLLALQAAAGALISVTYSADLCDSLWTCKAVQGSVHASDLDLFAALPIDASGKAIAAPAAASIQTAHRILGVANAALYCLFGIWLMRFPAQRMRGALLLVLAASEGAVGIVMAAHGFPLLAAIAHNALAASLLLVLVSLAWPRISARDRASTA